MTPTEKKGLSIENIQAALTKKCCTKNCVSSFSANDFRDYRSIYAGLGKRKNDEIRKFLDTCQRNSDDTYTCTIEGKYFYFSYRKHTFCFNLFCSFLNLAKNTVREIVRFTDKPIERRVSLPGNIG